MSSFLHSGLATLRRHYREKILVVTLSRLNDHLLADIGLRRDQLQPDGIHDLDVQVPRRPAPRRPARRTVVRPSLQGCG